MMRTAGRALTWLAGSAIVLSAFAILPSLSGLLVFTLTAGIFTAPGWPLARWFAGSETDRLTRGLLALPFGYFAGATTTCLLRLAGISFPLVVLAVIAAGALLLSWMVRHRQAGVVSLTDLGPRDRIALAWLWLLAMGIVGPVFARAGSPVPAGLAYHAYFNADLFVHMSVVAELAKGAAPPLNPYYPVEPLPYYWTYFTLPGLFAQLRPALPVDPGILLTDVGTAFTFISVGYVVVRNIGASTRATVISWIVILLASSFEGSYFLWRQVSEGRPFDEFRVWNIDAVTRWIWNLPGVDGFHRAMWWTPQHLVALSLALIVLLTLVRAHKPNGLGPAILEGLLLGGIVALSSFNGVMLVVWYAVAQLLMLVAARGRDIRRWLLARSVAAIIVIGFLGLTMLLGMVQMIPNAFLYGWNRFFLRGPWTFILLSFGPALFLAPLGFLAVFRVSRRLSIAIAALVGVSAVTFLFLDLRGHENTQVTFRTGQLLYICLAVLLAFAIDMWQSWRHVGSLALSVVLFVAAAAALPTVALDWYNARDISNVTMNPGGFPWTVHVSPDDQAAAQWIHTFLPPNATVQTDALTRARNTWAFVPAFARRRMGVGNGIFTLDPSRYEKDLHQVYNAYRRLPAEDAHAYFQRLGVDYVYVGDVERAVHRQSVDKFAAHPLWFEPVYQRGSAAIFKVTK